MSDVWRSRATPLVAMAAAVLVLSACNEDLDAGTACPALCPGQHVIVTDTVLDAVVFDTVVSGVPSIGSEGALLLASRGDTLDTRVILRFDTLPSTVTRQGGDSAITAIDSAYLLLRLNTSRSRVTAPVRIDLYDVDTTAADTAAAVIIGLFRADRLIGGSTLDTNQVKDSLRVYFANDKLLARIRGPHRLRVGMRLTSAAGGQLSFGSFDVSAAAQLKFDPVPSDTAIKEIAVSLRSDSPTNNIELQNDLLDYFVVAAAPPRPPGDVLSIGGLPPRRAFLRFNVPLRILDSATVLRATLLLTQRPNPFLSAKDSVLILPQVVTAGEEVTDFARAATLLSVFPVDTLRIVPGDSGTRQIEVAAALRQWSSSVNPFRQQRALVIRSADEGLGPFDAHFYSLEAPAHLRPRLRVSYSLRTTFGIP
ncbi:MAG: hypothetical protein ACT4P7_01680 [Gemmatimonadaceae bacterium]